MYRWTECLVKGRWKGGRGLTRGGGVTPSGKRSVIGEKTFKTEGEGRGGKMQRGPPFRRDTSTGGV